nr:MAG TPA: hypothetical protein [Caudoviricetes sp.]
MKIQCRSGIKRIFEHENKCTLRIKGYFLDRFMTVTKNFSRKDQFFTADHFHNRHKTI